MAENDFEKTVKLQAAGSGMSDKTVKLTPDMEKTAKMTVPAPQEMPPAPQAAPSMPPVPPPSAAALQPSSPMKIVAIALSVIIVLAGAAWFFVPGMLKDRAEKMAKEGKHSDAAKQLKTAVSLFPLHPETYLIALGRELRLAKDYPDAQKNLEKALSKKPNDFTAMFELGMTYRDSGQKDKAFDLLQKCSQMKSSDSDLMKMTADLAFDLKKYKDAAAAYTSLVKSGKGTAEDWMHLGNAQMELGNMNEAMDALNTALQKNNQLKGVNAALAKINLSQQKFAEAIQSLKAELALNPQDPWASETLGETALNAGKMALSSQKWNDAIRFFQDGLSVTSKNSANLHYQLAVAYSKQKKKKDVFSHLSEALKADATLKMTAKKEGAFALYRKTPDFQKLTK